MIDSVKISRIHALVCAELGIDYNKSFERKRNRILTEARYMTMYFYIISDPKGLGIKEKLLTQFFVDVNQIGWDRCTIKNGVKIIENMRSYNGLLRCGRRVNEIIDILTNALNNPFTEGKVNKSLLCKLAFGG